MSKRLMTSSVLTMAIGAIVGYGAAMADFRQPAKAASSSTAPAKTDVAKTQPVELPAPASASASPACCSEGLSRSDQLAILNHNQLVAASLAQSGKKPNFCIIWGDDIGQSNI
ncbi:MAG: arylsulfatase, partial [Schlesneria sp.]